MKRVLRSKYVRVLLMLTFAVVMALFFVLLGTFGGVGYHVHRIQELSFQPNSRFGYADAEFTFDATYNPILHPFYWLIGRGHVSGNFSMMYLPQYYHQLRDFPIPIWGSPEVRSENYISFMVTGGTFANLAVLLILTVIIEISRRRVLYLLLFSGIIGFSAGGVIGITVGSIIGALVALYILKRGYTFSLAGLRGYIVRRIIYSFILVILTITFSFVIFMLIPANPMDFLASKISLELESGLAEETRGLWGVNQPLAFQYFTYVRNLLCWNLGKSVRTPMRGGLELIPISESLAEKLPYTVFLLGTSTIISVLIGVLLGIVVVQKRGGMFDTFSSVFSTIMFSLPVWCIGLMVLLVFSRYLGWFPSEGLYPVREWAVDPPVVYTVDVVYSSNTLEMVFDLNIQDTLRLIGGYLSYAFLPLGTLVLWSFGNWVLLTRASLLQTIGEDYLVTARAKGLPEWKIWTKHALRNACLPLITSAASSISFVVAGSWMVETVFTYPGIGLWMFDSIKNRDYAVLMIGFYIISLCVIISNIIADLLYGLIDPRIKSGQKRAP